MKKLFRVLSALILGVLLGSIVGTPILSQAIPANVGGVLNLVNGAKLMAVDGYKLVLGAEDGADGGVEVNIEGAVKYTLGQTVLTSVNPINVTGDVISSTSGGTLAVQEATSGDKCMGSVTGTGTSAVTVATSCATTGSRIFVSRSSAPSGTAQCWTTNIVTGTSFDFDCDGAETGTFHWFIVHEAA